MTPGTCMRTVDQQIEHPPHHGEHDMNSIIHHPSLLEEPGDAPYLQRLKVLLAIAVGLCSLAAIAGFSLWLIEPASDSSTERALGLTAAAAGLGTGALAITAVIYAQRRNLWRYASRGVRWAATVVIAIAVLRSLLGALGGIS